MISMIHLKTKIDRFHGNQAVLKTTARFFRLFYFCAACLLVFLMGHYTSHLIAQVVAESIAPGIRESLTNIWNN